MKPKHREYHVGKSDYSKYEVEVWDIWRIYNLNPWEADIVKRVLRRKAEYGLSETESRIMDYEKIKHICDEMISQLKGEFDVKKETVKKKATKKKVKIKK